MKETTTHVIEEILNSLDALRVIQDFDESYYPMIDELIEKIVRYKREGILSNEDIKEISYYYGNDFLENTLQGRALLKRFGYAGDFLMIESIYKGQTPEHPFYKSWDRYFHKQAAPRAVRNRKEYFKKLILEKFENQNEIKLLNVASGPAIDLLELFQVLPSDKKLTVTCVDADKFAIEYAKKITMPFIGNIEFINKNIFRFETDEKYDFIWSAGAFDYFDDKIFVYVLKKFKNWIAEGGEIAVGNFNANHNPSRNYMEIFGEWFLHHRAEFDLINLGIQAGLKNEQMGISREAENVNLFLHINM
ncbi:class I SAM-dependent methyltransferase [Maribellus maritimus]|uniref:class I SAM-dependent methyltransferase n=1 Tax=Maribellus maritimus TaxID=2870838 RepID=UPI001EEBA9FF|nr:class I SAM-dependent methyltransferase [Maribellus maritimus]MCG6189765.1 class I SAM-dependent methyltransferase [Maribellus maritimus]